MSPGILCVIKRPELQEVMQLFFESFELEGAEWLDDIELLQTGMEIQEEIKIFQCLLLDQAFGNKHLLTTLKLARYLPQTRPLDIIVFANPGQAVFPIYQAGASLCMDTPLDPTELEAAFDRLFGRTDVELSEPAVEFEESNIQDGQDS